MNMGTETTDEDLIGITLAVLMFVLQGCMVLTMSQDRVAAETGVAQSMMVAAAEVTTAGLPV